MVGHREKWFGEKKVERWACQLNHEVFGPERGRNRGQTLWTNPPLMGSLVTIHDSCQACKGVFTVFFLRSVMAADACQMINDIREYPSLIATGAGRAASLDTLQRSASL